MSSIDHDHESEPADAPAEQIAVDGSVGSDTDIGVRPRSDSIAKDDSEHQHHARSNSVKKPALFKAVSVTKNFLAKAGTPAVPNTKINGESAQTNGVGATPPVPRPRLVAKSASNTKGALQKGAHDGSKNGNGSGPDPMQVWNRNRAAPQPTPKHFTDEELKQQYGIHLATRLQADGDGKEAKWADIDDDEDDWAPETIEWNDGTKITLSQNDTAAILAEEQAVASAMKTRQEEENKAKALAQRKPTTTVGPNATVLKPRSALQPKTGGLILKTPSEKPTLVSKPAAPAPVRSPWAALPPVDKVAPIEINPPKQSVPPRFQQNASHAGNTATAPPPAVEIAADDFSRNRREIQTGNHSHLYNAQSGLYEPAVAGRRGSVRKDQNFRPASLLQRGSANEQVGAVESSAASQAEYPAGQQGPNVRKRRTSSTVSGDFGSKVRRASTSKGADFRQDRRGSQQSQNIHSPSTPSIGQYSQSTAQSPALHHSQLGRDGHSPTRSPYQNRASDSTAASMQDEMAAQKLLMKEKREMAIKRRKEEEQREEAAKKERIRQKMESLGMEPLSDKKEPAKKEAVTISVEKRKAKNASTDKQDLQTKGVDEGASQVPVQGQEAPTLAAVSPIKLPATAAPGASTQYGMIKLHASPMGTQSQQANEVLSIEKARSQNSAHRVSPPGLESRPETIDGGITTLVNGIQTHADAIFMQPDATGQGLLRESRQQPWNNNPRESNPYASWNGQPASKDPNTISNNVWGAPSQSRALGNGTFDRSIQRPHSRPHDQFSPPALAPIGPPKHLQLSRDPREHGRPNHVSPVTEDFQTIPTFPPSETSNHINRSDQTGLPASADHKIVPAQIGSQPQLRPSNATLDQVSRNPDQKKLTLAAWGNFARDDAEKRRLQQQDAKYIEETQTGIRHEAQLPVMNETWRQVKADDQGTGRSIIGVTRAQNTHGQMPLPETGGDMRKSSLMSSMHTVPPMTAGVGRGSRFFPAAGRGLQRQGQPMPFTPGYRRGSSPPPPDASGHPAFSGDPQHPVIQLPPNPKPKVKLPPSITAPVPSSRVADGQRLPLPTINQPLVNNPSWQDRFNGLLGVKKLSPEKRSAQMAGFSATKEPLDLPSTPVVAAVSLPRQSASPSNLSIASINLPDEEALFDEPQAGSLPVVVLPTRIPGPAWSTFKPLKRHQIKLSQPIKEVEAASKKCFVLPEILTEGGVSIFINILGMVPKSKVLPLRNRKTNGQESQRQRPTNSNATTKGGRGPKPREGSGTYGHNTKNSHNARAGVQRNIQSGSQRNVHQKGPDPQSQPQFKHIPAAWESRIVT